MDIFTRKSGHYFEVIIEEGNTSIDFNLLDVEQSKNLLSTFKQAVEDLEWFIHTEEK